jgi:hypothetical protein
MTLGSSSILRPLVLAIVTVAISASGCGSGGEDCSSVPACKYVDILAGCAPGTGCASSGSVVVTTGDFPEDPTLVQEELANMPPGGTSASMAPGSTITIQLPTDPGTLAARPILDVVFEGADADLELTIDGQSPCAQQSGPFNGSVEWRCALPAGSQVLELKTFTAQVTVNAVQLTEATCTGTKQLCLL